MGAAGPAVSRAVSPEGPERGSFLNEGRKGETHFSSEVFLDHSAYLTAAGSSFARKAARHGRFMPFAREVSRLSRTSLRRRFAMVSARTTLQVLGTSCAIADGLGQLRGANWI